MEIDQFLNELRTSKLIGTNFREHCIVILQFHQLIRLFYDHYLEISRGGADKKLYMKHVKK